MPARRLGGGCPASCMIMAGGRGERLGGPAKPLIEVCGEPMVLRVARALRASGVCPILAVAYAPRTSAILSLPWEELAGSIVFIETRGAGYPADLREALQGLPLPVLVAPADLPHLDPRTAALAARELCRSPWEVASLASPRGLTGLSLHRRRGGSSRWGTVTLRGVEWWRLLDVDTPRDLEEAEEHCL
jgi:adenosylcobinamide-phosphate guanylyltransferase